ncbi:2-oxo acid dehydrogenase subunit E2 [Anaerotignum propionicum]|uniref:2-oxo acid dehydrogenase subunit E2 n=1 Tax=Anaerotignum propionicum TaxID=28446 RepID=UPI002108AC19|nr:2-oxo acid dehydrogenase subunit E2 [Anaerotignum propionicum]MCQ4935775.1 2-oxo acid dehydrogenase subunit E2 [Anaerotignum propionicum]
MAQEVLLPKLGLTMTEGTIDEWKFKEGEHVKKGDILYSVSTDKLTNDVEADTEGVLLKILVPAGETAACKAVVAYLGEAGEIITGASAQTKTEEKPQEQMGKVTTESSAAPIREGILASPAAKKLAKEKNIEIGLVVGTGPNGRITLQDVEDYIANPQPDNSTEKTKTSPMAAKLAEELGVDIETITTDGRVMKKDVLAAANAETTIAPAMSNNDQQPVKVNALRRSIAANMTLSWQTSPRVTYTHPVDTTAMKEMRDKLKIACKEDNVKLTFNHIIMKMTAKVLMEFPDVNASFADNMLTRHTHANVGLAVAKGDGLIVPNVKGVDTKSLIEVAKETEALIEAARSGKISMEDMTGGTFTISNLGPYGITNFSPIINQPELAILGVCDMVETPVVRNGQIEIRPMMNLCLTADHRVVDGVMAAKFLKRLCDLLENPYLLFT